MKSIALFLIERVFPRLFCGSECWDVEYELTAVDYADQEIVVTGTHRTYQPLSKARSPELAYDTGYIVASEIGREIKLRSGIRGKSVQIKNAKRNW